MVEDVQALWSRCSAALRPQLSEATWRAWFDLIEPLELDGGILVLAVPSHLAKERIEARHLDVLRSAVVAASLLAPTSSSQNAPLNPISADPGCTGVSDLRIIVHTRALSMSEELPTTDAEFGSPGDRALSNEAPSRANQGARLARGTARDSDRGEEETLNSRYTFDEFVTGSSNRFAQAAAQSVAETPARSYNPLFIYGGAGLGKTHLIQAIGNYVRENFPARHVRYVSTETFLNEFVDAIRANTTMAFKRRYRECDVLLIDDIQFIQGREGLQEEFFHTFNSLYGASKQIVITSDRPPKSIATLEDRLRSRFLSGLITDVQPPDLETRLAILRKKAESDALAVPHEVLELIATHVRENIRELEGALIRVTAYANLSGQSLTRSLAEKILADILSADQPRRITPQVILQATSDTFGFSIEELCGTSRRRPLVIARQISMYVFRDLTDFSYPAIAREFGGRDHTTVIHAVEKISTLMRERQQIYDQVTELILLIKGAR
ncbi:MAG: chromosomal replication initiator protein DnaA [Acidimicrobiales bacterium]